MKTKEIIDGLLLGFQYGNESADWWTLYRPHDNIYIIVIKDKNYFYKNLNSYAKRIAQLIKRGY